MKKMNAKDLEALFDRFVAQIINDGYSKEDALRLAAVAVEWETGERYMPYDQTTNKQDTNEH
ncbi:MAG: hypothetical protein GY814_17565 [Gammaproteobacteria bacterium]|nr:hypothetical protein [Gammaproteobacteria bacterium]